MSDIDQCIGKIICGDSLEIMQGIPDKSVDMILCDLPYGTTACSWDTVIPFEPLWEQYKRISKDNTAIVLTGSEPFSSYLRLSNIEMYKYDWIWNKKKAGNIFLAEYQPMKIHENICVFSKDGKYYPQKNQRKEIKRSKNYGTGETMGGDYTKENKTYTYYDKFPESIIEFTNAVQSNKVHPTQKPVQLFKYLILTYTNENDIVLDNCLGSGTTIVAAEELGRRWIGIDISPEYCDISRSRVDAVINQGKLFT